MKYTTDNHKTNILWLESPFFDTLLDAAGYDSETKQRIKKFREDGVLLFDPEIPEEKLDRVIEDLKFEYRGGGRIQDAWKKHESVREIASWQKILDLLGILYQRDPVPFQTLNFPVGTEQKTHSDCIHFHSFPPRFMCGVSVALEDVDLKNGPLHYYRESHKLPLFDMHDIGLPASNESYPEYEHFVETMLEASGLERVDITLHKGQAVLWAANTFHGGSPVRERNRTRHSQVTHYFFSHCIYYTPMHSDPFLGKLALRQFPDVRTGEVVPHFYNGRRLGLGTFAMLERASRSVVRRLRNLSAS